MAIVKVKNLKGRITGYRAYRGNVSVMGENPKHAENLLEQAVDQALSDLSRGTEILTWNNQIIVIAPSIYQNWTYWLQGFSNSYTCGGHQTFEDARVAAFCHLAQNLWNLSIENDAAFVEDLPVQDIKKRDLLSWMKWQRSYAALKAQGKTDVEAHALASGYAA